MTGYRCAFYKTLLSSDGHRFKCLQGEIEVVSSSTTAARAQASSLFSHERGCDWRIYADDIEVLPLDSDFEESTLRAA